MSVLFKPSPLLAVPRTPITAAELTTLIGYWQETDTVVTTAIPRNIVHILTRRELTDKQERTVTAALIAHQNNLASNLPQDEKLLYLKRLSQSYHLFDKEETTWMKSSIIRSLENWLNYLKQEITDKHPVTKAFDEIEDPAERPANQNSLAASAA